MSNGESRRNYPNKGSRDSNTILHKHIDNWIDFAPNLWYTYIVAISNGHNIESRWEYMTEGEMLKLSVEEFSRLQQYMLLSEKDSAAYKSMKIRYIELKVILSASGVNLTELDMIKE